MRGSNQDDLAFAFSERRLHFYRAGTLIELGAFPEESLLRSGEQGFHSLDLGLVLLEQAEHLARDGDVERACGLAVEALMRVPVEQRTSIVLNRAQALLSSVPDELNDAQAVRDLRELLEDTLPQTPLAALAVQAFSNGLTPSSRTSTAVADRHGPGHLQHHHGPQRPGRHDPFPGPRHDGPSHVRPARPSRDLA
jgi:hypothetical protein